MQCPIEVAEIVNEILRIGILRVRALAWNGDAERCAIEADHLHNLPALLSEFQAEKLEYYLQVERAAYVRRSSPDDLACFQSLWSSLAEWSASAKKPTLAG